MNKLLVICGPTSTGKTSLAIRLAKKFNGEIVSADSRQVYKGLNIGTGKDLPKGVKIKYPWFGKYGYYVIDGVKVWGYDLADPRHEYSIAQYLKFANRIVGDIIKSGKLPILTGGTGLYLKAIIDGIPTASIPRDNRFRRNLEGRSADALYEMLAQMDSLRAAQMNSSDKKNPRRLIRAIEVATWKINNIGKDRKIGKQKKYLETLVVGLSAPKEFLDKKIEERVVGRVKMGLVKEIEGLIKRRVGWDTQAMSSMGYRQWRPFFEGKKKENEVLEDWKKEEEKYAKRQLTWFKKDGRIKWFDITERNSLENVEKLVKKWYSSGVNAEEG